MSAVPSCPITVLFIVFQWTVGLLWILFSLSLIYQQSDLRTFSYVIWMFYDDLLRLLYSFSDWMFYDDLFRFLYSISRILSVSFLCYLFIFLGFDLNIIVRSDYWQENEEFIEEGVAVEPFNLEKEREEGYFDENGNYVEYVNRNEIKVARSVGV